METKKRSVYSTYLKQPPITVRPAITDTFGIWEDIYEFKAPNTARICFFYDTGLKSFIICTHGFAGKKGSEKKFIQGQIEKAVKIKNEYFGEKG